MGKPQGVVLEDLEDSYCKAKMDLAAWNQSGRTIHFMNNDTKKHIVLWYYGRLRKHPIQTEKEKEAKMKLDEKNGINQSDEAKDKINMETPEEIIDSETKSSKKPMRRKAANLGGNKRKKRRLNMSRMNLTNIHMLQNEEVKTKLTQQSNAMQKDKSDRELPTLS